jgi:hypothetical protein
MNQAQILVGALVFETKHGINDVDLIMQRASNRGTTHIFEFMKLGLNLLLPI